jgi:hypothetical protein
VDEATLRCRNPTCEREMLGLVTVKVSGVRLPHLEDVNRSYWTFDWKDSELQGAGYVCPNCGNVRIIKPYVIDKTTGLATAD